MAKAFRVSGLTHQALVLFGFCSNQRVKVAVIAIPLIWVLGVGVAGRP